MTIEGATEPGRDLACTVTRGVIQHVRRVAGEDAPAHLLEIAGSSRALDYLEDIANWVSRDEAVALFAAAEQLTGDPDIGRHVGEEAIRQYTGTPVATTLRSLGSIEEILRQIATVASKFSAMSSMEVVEIGPGRAVVKRSVNVGYTTHRFLCEWGAGLLSSAPMLYGIPPARVEERTCQARGDEHCLIEVSWDGDLAARTADPAQHITALEGEIAALNESLESMYAVAGDLIADRELQPTLAKITDRSASAVRAPRYLLVVRPSADAPLAIHSRGMSEEEAEGLAGAVLSVDPKEADERWLMADISSHRRHYGRIVALFERPQSFFPRERKTLEHYARYAANALDLSIALDDARRGHTETRALLDFARSLSGATRQEVASRLAEAIPHLVDCDRVAVFLEQDGDGRLRCAATHGYPPELDRQIGEMEIVRGREDPELSEALFTQTTPRALFFGPDSSSPFVHDMVERFGSEAYAFIPILARGKVLGSIGVSVTSQPARLHETRELQDRLSGIVAQAAVGLENGELIDRMSYQASHDPLTGLVNRSYFGQSFEHTLELAREQSTPLGLFYVDLDRFKSVNDEHGHEAGDELLCQVASRLLGVVRAQDTVARLGGDEFAIILRDVTDRGQIDAAAERVARAFSAPFRVADIELQVQASLGRAVWPYDGEELAGLLRHADASMYRVKRAAAGDSAVAGRAVGER